MVFIGMYIFTVSTIFTSNSNLKYMKKVVDPILIKFGKQTKKNMLQIVKSYKKL